MPDIILEEIYTRVDDLIPEYLEVLFITNQATYQVLTASVSKATIFNITGFVRAGFLENLRSTYGPLRITDARITYDNEKYFLIANAFLLVLYYELTSAFNNSLQTFRIVEDLNGVNEAEFAHFLELDKLEFA